MSYQTVPLTEEILPALLDLERACFAHPWTENMFLGEIKNPAAQYKILTDGSRPIAYMGLWTVADEGQITNVAVHPDYRRRGLAKQLITAFVDFAKAQDLSLLTLEVRESNAPAISLYESLGFTRVGKRKNYYEGKETALLLTLFLKGV